MKNIFNIILLLFIILISSNRIIAQISIPEQISPPDSFEFVPVDLLFQWYEVYGADSYRIQIALDENFYSIICDEDGLVNPEFQSSEYILDFTTLYYWRVNASNENFTSEWSNVWSFTTDDFSPSNFVWLISPYNNSLYVPTSSLFTWDEVMFDEVNYQIQISTDSLFNNINIEQITTETEFEANNLNYDTKYFWRVIAYNESYSTFWSKIWSFTTVSDSISNFNIPLISGWNLISSNVIPTEQAMENVFEGMNNIIFVKNEAGQIFFPAFGLNQIGDWNVEAGYYVYTNSSSILNISGNEVNPVLQGIQLNPGWHLVSYLRNSPMNVQQALGSIASNLIIAKNNLGGIYHPGFGINTLGEMQPGQGYWLYISSPALLTYPEN